MERETGIEPVTSSLGSWRSTAELLPLNFVRLPFRPIQDNVRSRPLLAKVKRFTTSFQKTHAKSLELTTGYTGLRGEDHGFRARFHLCISVYSVVKIFAAAENVRRIQSGSTDDDALLIRASAQANQSAIAARPTPALSLTCPF